MPYKFRQKILFNNIIFSLLILNCIYAENIKLKSKPIKSESLNLLISKLANKNIKIDNYFIKNHLDINAQNLDDLINKIKLNKNTIKDKQQKRMALKIFNINYLKINKELENKIQTFWNSLINQSNEKNKKVLTLNKTQRIIIARGHEKEIHQLKNFIKSIDKPSERVKFDVFFISTDKEFDISTGINWSGIYNRLKSIQQNNKDFDFVGIGGTLTDIPVPTSPVERSDTVINEDLFVDPDNFSINTFSPPISNEFGQIQEQFGTQTFQLLKLPVVFGGPDLNLSRLNALINASKLEETIRTDEKPTIITNDNEIAKILIGQSLPFYSTLTQSVPNTSLGSGVFSTLFYREIGISLQLKPKISQDKKHISVDIYLELADVEKGNLLISIFPPIQGTLIEPPQFNTVKIRDNILLKEGETVSIGQLSQIIEKENFHRTPFLAKLPFIGKLFTSKGQQKIKKRIYILVTPTIIQ